MTDLKQRMKEAGIETQADLAKATGYHRNSIGGYCDGVLPEPTVVTLVIEVLKEHRATRKKLLAKTRLCKRDIKALLDDIDRFERRVRLGIGTPKGKS